MGRTKTTFGNDGVHIYSSLEGDGLTLRPSMLLLDRSEEQCSEKEAVMCVCVCWWVWSLDGFL